MVAQLVRRPPRAVLLPALLGVLLVGLVATSLWLWRRTVPPSDDAPVAVARQAAQNFFTLSFQHPDEDLDRVLRFATDPFKSQYAARREEIKRALVDKKLTLTARIPENGSALEYRHGNEARVLVAVDGKTVTVDGRSETNRYRVRVRLVHLPSGWLVSDLTQVG